MIGAKLQKSGDPSGQRNERNLGGQKPVGKGLLKARFSRTLEIISTYTLEVPTSNHHVYRHL